MSGLRSKRKGWRGENGFVKRMEALDIPAERMPLSGALGGVAGMDLSGDVKLWTIHGDYKVEVKCRANGFKQIYDWIEPDNIDLLSLKADRKPGLIVMTEDTFAELVKEAEAK